MGDVDFEERFCKVISDSSMDQVRGLLPSASIASVFPAGLLLSCAEPVLVLLVEFSASVLLMLSRLRISVASSSAMVMSGLREYDGDPWRNLCK